MDKLAAGCRVSQLKVFPTNWAKDPSSMQQTWYIKYRFYDPDYTQPKQVVLKKDLNSIDNWKDRIIRVDELLREESRRLRDGYNPFHSSDATQTMLQALEQARLKVKVAHNTRIDMKSMLKYFGQAAARLRWQQLTIMAVRRKHIILILEECYKRDSFTDNTFNHYRKYLLILFRYIVSIDLLENNPITEIEVRKTDLVQRLGLTDEQRQMIQKFLRDNYYSFWRFINVFFHSGCRRSELLRVKKSDVSWEKGIFQVTINKGQKPRKEDKVILNCVEHLWEEILQQAKPTDYLFSTDLLPGPRAIRPEQTTRRWYRHVKEKLGVKADMYWLKHLHTDTIAELLDIEAAAEHDSHSSTAVTKKHYAFGEKKRRQQAIKSLNIRL